MRKQWCYWINESQDPKEHGGYVPSLVTENEAGHSPLIGRGKCAAPWVWGKTLKEAKQVCELANARRGIDNKTAFRIVASSIAASEIVA
jgi:hypothetical protein